MKKILSTALTFVFIMLSFCSCFSSEDFNYNSSDLKSRVLEVELVFVERESYCGEMSIELIQSLSSDRYEAFFERLSDLTYETKNMIHPENVVGNVIMLKFDGENNFDLVGTQGIENHRASNGMIYINKRCNADEYNSLVKEFFDCN